MAVEPIFEAYGNKLIGVPNNEESSGSGGHVIENSSGTDLPQRANMQFVDAQLSDDSTYDRTKIEVIKRVTKAQLDALGENTDGIYETTDEDDIPVGDIEEDYVEVTADGVKTYATLLNELYALVDKSKLNNNSYIRQSSSYTVYKYASHNDSSIKFFYVGGSTSNYDINLLQLGTNQEDNLYIGYSTSTSSTAINNVSSNIVPNGRKITLYYGTKSSTIQLNTDAQHCIMSDGETSVEEAIDNFTNLSNVRKAFLSISGTVSSAADVAQEIIDSIDTSDGKNVIFEGIHQYAGIRMIYGYIYANKSYGAIFIATIGSYRYVGLNNGVLTVTNIV